MSASRRDLLLAAVSGLLLGLAFPPLHLGALAWVAFLPLLAALERRVAAGAKGRSLYGLGWAGGFVFFLAGTHWIAELSDVASTVPWLKYLGWVLAGAYLANFWALAAWFAGALSRRSGVPARWTFVPAMLLVEELRGSGELGFPWFQPGYTQHALPALQLAATGGVTLVTAWVLAVNAAAGSFLVRRTRAAAGLALALLALPWAVTRWSRAAPPAPGPRVALVQGNIAGEIKWSGAHQQQILETFLALSDSAVAGRTGAARPALIVWPETATGSYLKRQLEQSVQVARWCVSRRVPIFTGFADYAYDAAGKPLAWNAAGMWRADATQSEVYAKRHLVPFGERMPFEWLLPALGKVDLGQAEWTPGTKTVLFDGPSGPFSCLVCFESIFPHLARADVRAGSRLLVIVTNDEWFGRSSALEQHAAMAPFRAVENAVPVLRCANTGRTDVIDARGRVVASAPVFTACVLQAAIPAAGPRTWYTRLGDWPGLLALLLAAGLALAPWRRRRA